MSNPEDAQALRVAEQLLRELQPGLPKSDEVLALAAKVQLLLMDVDGVLTNGKLYNVPNRAPMAQLAWHQDGRDQRAAIAGHRGARPAM
jgi:hypothetical protein